MRQIILALLFCISSQGFAATTAWEAPSNNEIPLGSSSGVAQYVFGIYYSVYNTLPPAPPTSFTGHASNNHFLTQTDRIYELAWTPADDPSVVNYLLRRNGILIHKGSPNGPYNYADHDRSKERPDIYTLTTQDGQGLESSPLTVTFAGNYFSRS